MGKKLQKFIFTALAFLCISNAFAQQPLKNNAFLPGETLEYKMYFNWQFIWVNAGTATMTTTSKNYSGKNAYCCALTTRSSQKIDKYFRLRDTLLCYTTQDLIPLYYRKGAREGDRYYVDELFYKYNNGCTVTMKELTSKGKRNQKQQSSKNNIYDMLSIFLRARNFDPKGWNKGHTIIFPIADGNGIKNAKLRFRGRSKIKAEDDKRYSCLELSYIETDDGKEKEIVRFFVTDDSRHIPIRIDLFLKFGSAKAYLKSMKGVKSV